MIFKTLFCLMKELQHFFIIFLTTCMHPGRILPQDPVYDPLKGSYKIQGRIWYEDLTGSYRILCMIVKNPVGPFEDFL